MPPRRNLRKRAARKPRRSTKKVSARFAKKVRKVIKAESETKYVAENLVVDGYVIDNIQGQSSQRRLISLLPAISQGTARNNRIGNKIQPIKMTCTAQYYFHTDPYTSPSDISGVTVGPPNQTNRSVIASGIYEVRQVCVQPKFSKSSQDWLLNNGSDIHGKLLDSGTGTLVPANSADPQNLNYPIFKDEFTPTKGNKKFMLAKNNGMVFGSTDYPLADMRAQNTIHWSVKCPKVFHYDQASAGPTPLGPSFYPTNFNPLFGNYAGVLANSGATSLVTATSSTYGQLIGTATTAGAGQYYWTSPIVRYNLRVELWYKDL